VNTLQLGDGKDVFHTYSFFDVGANDGTVSLKMLDPNAQFMHSSLIL
jgi:hypothetical protein